MDSLSIGIILLPNFTLVAFASFIDTLRLAADVGDRSRQLICHWSVLSGAQHSVKASCGLEVKPWEGFETRRKFDYIAIAGGLLPKPGQRLLDPATIAFLCHAQRQGTTLIGLCTGGIALAEAGFIPPGGRCCVSWFHLADLQERVPEVTSVADQLWLEENRVISCAGGVAAADLAASLVQRHIGGAVAQKSLHIMLMDGPRTARAAQPQPPNTAVVHDKRVRRVMLLLEQHLADPPSVEWLAKTVAISKRQLERLFIKELGVSIRAFRRDLRLAYALWLILRRTGRISDIAAQCGFADTAHFSRLFRRALGRSPSLVARLSGEQIRGILAGWWPYDSISVQDQGVPLIIPDEANRRPYV